MTIITTAPIRRLPYRGYDHPALPTGIWWGTGVVVGDASGGTQQVRFEVHAEGAPVSGDMWNIEQVMAFISITTTTSGFLTAVGLSPSRDSPGVDALYRVVLASLGGGLGNAGIAEVTPGLPVFLGAVRGGADTGAAVGLGVTNLTATDSLSVSMMGYIWEARSQLTEGGLQRPPGGLFGNV